MARYFAPITPVALREKFLRQFESVDDFLFGDSKARKDLDKVEFDGENYVDEPTSGDDDLNPLLGIRTLKNGMTYWGIKAGGDWEYPVFFIVYWDGKEIRGYVPHHGNTWNYKTKAAYGNEMDIDPEEAMDLAEAQLNVDLLVEDIQNRIKVKEGEVAKAINKVLPKKIAKLTDEELLEYVDEAKRRGLLK